MVVGDPVAPPRPRRQSARTSTSSVSSKKSEENHDNSVLHDSAALKEAANKASNGGKKRIVGLYLPDGSRVMMEEKQTKAAKAAKEKEDKDKKAAGAAGTDSIKKDFASEAARKKGNLSEVGHSYNMAREYKQKKAYQAKKDEDTVDDEIANRRAKAILSNVNEREEGRYGELFKNFDVDNDGTWGSIEFAQRMTDIGFPTGVEDAANLLYFAGVRDVDRITYNDFLQMMPKLAAFRRIIEKDSMRVFSTFDTGSGYISLKQLQEVLEIIAGPDGLDRGFMASVLKKSDRERTGRIPFDFFIKALFGSPPLVPYKRDMKKASLTDKLLSLLRCGSTPKQEASLDEEEDAV